MYPAKETKEAMLGVNIQVAVEVVQLLVIPVVLEVVVRAAMDALGSMVLLMLEEEVEQMVQSLVVQAEVVRVEEMQEMEHPE